MYIFILQTCVLNTGLNNKGYNLRIRSKYPTFSTSAYSLKLSIKRIILTTANLCSTRSLGQIAEWRVHYTHGLGMNRACRFVLIVEDNL